MLWWPPNHNIISLLLCNCNFASVMNRNVNIRVSQWSWGTPVKGSFSPQRGHSHQVVCHWYRQSLKGVPGGLQPRYLVGSTNHHTNPKHKNTARVCFLSPRLPLLLEHLVLDPFWGSCWVGTGGTVCCIVCYFWRPGDKTRFKTWWFFFFLSHLPKVAPE